MAEAIPNFCELRQCVCNRQSRRLQYTKFVKGVVPSDADYQVSSITGQPAQLTAYLTDYGAIPGEQVALRPCGNICPSWRTTSGFLST